MEKLLKAKSEAKAAARTAWGSATAYMLVYVNYSHLHSKFSFSAVLQSILI